MDTRRQTAAIYARVSTADQNCEMQLTELRALCRRMGWRKRKVYMETASGKAGAKRPMLDRLLRDARARVFDVVLVWKLDRFGRSVADLIGNIQILDSMGIRFMATTQGIDTDQRNPVGKLIITIMGAIAEFERDLIRERVKAGVAQYRRDLDAGKVGRDRHSHSGKDLPPHRPRRVFDRGRARELHQQGWSLRKIAAELGVPRTTIAQSLKEGWG